MKKSKCKIAMQNAKLNHKVHREHKEDNKKNYYLTLVPFVFFMVMLIFSFLIYQGNHPAKTEIKYKPKVLSFYYNWYGTPKISGQWRGWNGAGHNPDVFINGLRDTATTDHPFIDAYDSQDLQVIRYHLDLARKAGIDAFICTWWGQGDFTDKSLKLIMDEIEKGKYSTRVTIYYETVPNNDYLKAIEDFDYILKNYGQRESFFKVNGKPVIFVYARAIWQLGTSVPLNMIKWDTVISEVQKKYPSIFLADWLFWPFELEFVSKEFKGVHFYNPVADICQGKVDMAQEYLALVEMANEKGIISANTVIPGYNDSHIDRSPPTVLDRENGFLYNQLWTYAIDSSPDWILITSFNEWFEGTEIESSIEHQDTYINLTKKYSDLFRLSKVYSQRIAGTNRYETAVEISKREWGSSDVAILCRGDDFPDSLCAAPLAAKYDAPILLTPKDYLAAVTKDEISRLKSKEIFVIGGISALSGSVIEGLEYLCHIPGENIHRIGGIDRYETSTLIASQLKNPGSTWNTAIIATGENFPDALSIAPLACAKGFPILLVNGLKKEIGSSTEGFLKSSQVKKTLLVGGSDVISDEIFNWFNSKKLSHLRLWSGDKKNDDRYTTCKAVFEYSLGQGMKEDNFFVATGEDFPDSLSASIMAGKKFNSPLILARNNLLPSVLENFLISKKESIFSFNIIGEEDVVSELVESKIKEVIK